MPKFHHDVLILTDRRLKSFRDFLNQFRPVIDHWKLPCRFSDVSDRDFLNQLRNCGLVLLLQHGIGRRLDLTMLKTIDMCMKEGAGLFVAEPSLMQNKNIREVQFSKYLPNLGKHVERDAFEVDRRPHFVSSTKLPREVIKLHTGVKTFLADKLPAGSEVVLRASGQPVLFFHRAAGVKIGFLLLAAESHLDRLGFGTSLDVFYWKSIIYLARKPFVQLLPPPWITFRIEDSIGEGKYAYLDDLIRNGFKVHLGLDLNDFDFQMAGKLRQHARAKAAEFSPHAFTHYKRTPTERTELIYSQFDGSPYHEEKLKYHFKRLDAFQKKSGIRFSPVLTYHYCQLGKNALPHLKKMGVRYLGFPFRADLPLARSLGKTWRLYPFGKLGLVCDRHPDDRDLFVVHALKFLDAKVVPGAPMDVATTSRLDFLYGLDLKVEGRRFSQYREVNTRVFEYVRWASENLFFACLFTHETLINYLRLPEFKRIVGNIKKVIRPFQMRHALYQDIAKYYVTRSQSSLRNCISFKRRRACTITTPKGSNRVLHLAVYDESKSGMRLRVREVCFRRSKIKVII